MFPPQTTQLSYPYENTQKMLLWSEMYVVGTTHVWICFGTRPGFGFKHHDSIPNFLPWAMFHSFTSDPFFYPFHNSVVCRSLLSPPPLPSLCFYIRIQWTKKLIHKRREFQTSRCLSSNHSLLSYCVLEVDNLWTSSWGICISVLFFWSIFLLQRHGTLMLLKSHYYGITWLQTAISSALRCVRRGDKVWNPWRACAEWIEKRRQEERDREKRRV